MGRKRALTEQEAEDVRRKFFTEKAPNGTRYNMAMLARLYRVTDMTICNIIHQRGAYAPQAQAEAK
jgi:hypothetical protein